MQIGLRLLVHDTEEKDKVSVYIESLCMFWSLSFFLFFKLVSPCLKQETPGNWILRKPGRKHSISCLKF